jgi:hypothetical protein
VTQRQPGIMGSISADMRTAPLMLTDNILLATSISVSSQIRCVCVRACVRACVRVCVFVCVCAYVGVHVFL